VRQPSSELLQRINVKRLSTGGFASGLAYFAAQVLLVTSMSALAFAQSSKPPQAASVQHKGMTGDAASRGKYIVEGVAVCGQCHTPRDENGTPDHTRSLEGASVWLKSAEPVEDWPLQAPRIAGTPPGTDAEMVTLLTTGIWRDGRYLRPPMPQFRMSREDAEAVVTYLKSVNPQAK
jgi:mono/diheme cytochrome c family protein